MLRNHDVLDVVFALLIVLFGFYVMWVGIELSVGELRRIGPGFFPAVLGVATMILGFAILFERRAPTGLSGFNWRGLTFVSAALLSFGLLLERAGLVPGVVALVLLVSYGSRDPVSWKAIVALIVGLCATGYLVFASGLGLPLRMIVGAKFLGIG